MSPHTSLAGLWRVVPIGAAALGGLLLLHHAREFVQVMHGGVDQVPLTLDFRTYMCGSADLIRPYDICHNGEFVSGFVYPPPSLAYFHSLTQLPIGTAFLLHSAVVIAVLGVACMMIASFLPGSARTRWAAVIAGLAIAPIGTGIAAGQVNILLMGSAVAGVWFASRGKPLAAGLSIAAGFWLKIYPALVPALFLTRRKFRAAAMTVAATITIGLAGLIWAAPDLYRQYFVDLLPFAQNYTMPGVAYSLAGTVAHIEAGGGQPVQHFVPIAPAVQWLSKLLLGAGVLAAMAHQHLTRDARPLDSLNVLLCASLIAAPNAWGYHYALILPAIISALAREFERPSRASLPIALCWLALVVPGWTDPPAVIAANPWLNVPFRERYTIVALILMSLLLLQLRKQAHEADAKFSAEAPAATNRR